MPLQNGWNLDFHLDWAWADEQFTATQNTITIPSYDKTNGRITLRSSDETWRVALYGTNLRNDEIIRGRSGRTTFYWHNPRQIALEVGYKR